MSQGWIVEVGVVSVQSGLPEETEKKKNVSKVLNPGRSTWRPMTSPGES